MVLGTFHATKCLSVRICRKSRFVIWNMKMYILMKVKPFKNSKVQVGVKICC